MTVTNPSTSASSESLAKPDALRVVAYNMDLMNPGLYIWLGKIVLRIGGREVDDNPYRYPGTLHSKYGIALVLPDYQIFTTYKGSYDPR
jgi:hypothetical protein